MTTEPDKPRKTARQDAAKTDSRKARLAEALRANLHRRKEAGAKARKPGGTSQNSET
jgi:hypothetical protein